MKARFFKTTLLFFICLTAHAQICFTTINYFPSHSDPRAITTADYNGDGNIDIAIANQYGKSVSVLFGNGFGNFAAPVNYTFSVNTDAIASGDFNNDGKLDIVASQANNSIKVLTNDGTGNFLSVQTFTMFGSAYSLLATDIDTDGDVDIITANDFYNNICVLKNNGSGSFPVALSYMAGTSPKGLTSADFNNDGYQDLAVASSGSNYIHIFKGLSTGAFAAMTSFTTGVNPNCIAKGDFNNDGKVDLATANGSKVTILKGSGIATFSATASYAVTQTAVSITCGDFNGDGKLDLATSNSNYTSNPDNASILIGTGVGTFTYTNILLGQQADDPLAITCADFNNDGRTDIATANNVSNNCTIILMCGNATTGELEQFNENSIEIYPNPITNDKLHINSDKTVNSVSIFNELGAEIYYKITEAKTDQELNVSELNSGIYFIKINNQESAYKKIIIIK